MTEIVRAQQVGEAMYRVVLRDPQAAREWRQDNRRLVTLTIPQLREQLVLTIWEADAFAGTITVYIPAAATRGPWLATLRAHTELPDLVPAWAVDAPKSRGPRLALYGLAGLLLLGAAAYLLLPSLLTRTKAPAAEFGLIRVETNPPGARVNLDGISVPETTPVTLDRVTLLTNHYVKVSLAGYQDVIEVVQVTPDNPTHTLDLTLSHDRDALGTLKVLSDPPGAQVFVDGRRRCKATPCQIAELKLRVHHEVRLERLNYHPKTLPITLEDATSVTKLTVTLRERRPGDDLLDSLLEDDARLGDEGGAVEPERYGALSVQTSVRCMVFLDGLTIGTSPLVRKNIDPGEHEVRLVNEDEFLDRAYRMTIVAGQTSNLEVHFRRGQLTFVGLPGIEVYLQGELLGTTPMAPVSLYEGRYLFRVVDPQIGRDRAVDQTVEAGVNQQVKVEFSLR